MQPELFAKPPPLILELRGIQVPISAKRRKKPGPLPPPNYHIPSKKNNKMLITKDPRGRPLKKPMLITKPEYLEWTEKAIASLESQLLSKCLTTGEGIQQALSKLSAILSSLPVDDSVNDLPNGSWSVQFVKPGEEGATIKIERL